MNSKTDALIKENSSSQAVTDEAIGLIQSQIKPLSGNGFVAFFQRLWRSWLNWWYSFSDKYPRASKLLKQFIFVFVLSNGVTIIQYLITLFLPMVMGSQLAGTEFMWPKIPMYTINGVQKYWSIFGYEIARNSAGEVIIGGGLGYFIAFEIATFVAQCVNFPLQRNITFKSHENPVIQAIWYFIGWVAISVFCNAINNLWLPLGSEYLPFAVYNILTMVSMGGISIVIFFFIFLIIFPDYNAVVKRTQSKLEKMKKSGADAAKIAVVEAKLADVSMKAKLANAEKAESKALSQASAKAMSYFAVVKNAEKAEADKKADFEVKKAEAFQAAIDAIKAKDVAIQERKATLAEASK